MRRAYKPRPPGERDADGVDRLVVRLAGAVRVYREARKGTAGGRMEQFGQAITTAGEIIDVLGVLAIVVGLLAIFAG
jgi:hypothetical protein